VAVGLAQAPERAAQPQAKQRVAEARRLDVGRRLVAEVGEEARQGPDAAVELDERRRVVVRPGTQGVHGFAEVRPQVHRPPVGLGGEHANLGRHQRQAVAGQRQLANDGRPEAPDRVREGRDADAGGELLGHGRTADAIARLEHEDPQAAGREVGGRGQPVVAGADDDRVVLVGRQGHVRPPSGRGP
jgi:hypothetical protein